MSVGMVESPAEKNKSRSFRDAESLGLREDKVPRAELKATRKRN